MRWIGLTLLSCWAGVSHAADSPSATAKEFLADFATYCWGNPGRPDKTIAAASLTKLKEVEPEILTAFGPQEPASFQKGWYVRNEAENKVLLAVTKSEIDGEPVSTCSLFSLAARANEVLPELSEEEVLPEPSVDQSSFGNRLRLWRTDILGDPVRLMLSNPSDEALSGVSLGIVAPLLER